MKTLALLAALLAAQESSTPDAAGVEFFEKRIRPVLAQKCYPCHSHQAGKPKGGLLLDTREGLVRVVVPGRPDRSPLIKAIQCDGEGDVEMPPKESDRLTEAQVADFVAW